MSELSFIDFKYYIFQIISILFENTLNYKTIFTC